MNTTHKLEIGYGAEKVIFSLRTMSLQEEDRYTSKRTDISENDDERYLKYYELYKDALGEFSTEIPTLNGKPIGKGSAVEVIQEYFKERSPEKERLARLAYLAYRNSLEPEYRFLPLSDGSAANTLSIGKE
jgi:hypothetical protein